MTVQDRPVPDRLYGEKNGLTEAFLRTGTRLQHTMKRNNPGEKTLPAWLYHIAWNSSTDGKRMTSIAEGKVQVEQRMDIRCSSKHLQVQGGPLPEFCPNNLMYFPQGGRSGALRGYDFEPGDLQAPRLGPGIASAFVIWRRRHFSFNTRKNRGRFTACQIYTNEILRYAEEKGCCSDCICSTPI